MKIVRWRMFVILSLAAAVFAVYPYFTLDPDRSRVALTASFYHYPLLLVHIFSSFLALAVGWLQFLPKLRTKRPRIHRTIGRFYLGFVAVGGVTGFAVGMFTESYNRQMAFLTLVVLWLFTAWKGYRAARRQNFDAHGVWMTRNYAVTLLAASARILTPVCILIYMAGHGGESIGGIETLLKQVLEVNIWLGLVVNLVVTEWTIVNRRSSGKK